MVGHIIFTKSYTSPSRFVQGRHEQAYLLAKGHPPFPRTSIPDVQEWTYTGNRLHPTQKPINVLRILIEAFCPPDCLVLDPFCGSGSTLVAARLAGCSCLGIESDEWHVETATLRYVRFHPAGCNGQVCSTQKRSAVPPIRKLKKHCRYRSDSCTMDSCVLMFLRKFMRDSVRNVG